jgi:hypothetical protein
MNRQGAEDAKEGESGITEGAERWRHGEIGAGWGGCRPGRSVFTCSRNPDGCRYWFLTPLAFQDVKRRAIRLQS